MTDLSHDDACRLSRAFGEASDLRTSQDMRINEWLKGLIRKSRPAEPHRTHTFKPHRKYPWFCGICGYASHEVLMHTQEPANPAKEDRDRG